MADNVDITAGSGTTIATDDSGTGHVQVVKLAQSADGSRTPITADGDGMLVNLGANNDVAVTSVVPGTGATNLGKAIDTAAGATDTGVAALAVRDDALSALTPVEGDFVPLRTDANGALWVAPSGTTTVSGTVTANLAAGTNNIGDVDVLSLPSIPAGTNNIGDVDVLSLPSIPAGNNNIGDVDVASTVTASNRTTSGNLTGNGQSLALSTVGCGVAIVTLTGTWVATVAFEGSINSGSSYAAVSAINASGGIVTDATANGTFIIPCGGFTNVQIRTTAYTSGTVGGALSASAGATNIWLGRLAANSGVDIGDVDILSIAAGDNNIGNVDIVTMPSIPAGTNNIGDVDVLTLPALPAGTNNIGDVDVLTVPADPFGANADAASATGSISAKLRQIAANGIPITSLPASTNTLEVVGDIAHDTGVGGNPVQVAGAAVAMADSAPGNRVSAAADVTRLATSLDGGVFVHPHGPQIWSYHVNGSSALTDATVKAAPGAGLSLYVTDIIISSGAATAMNAFFEEGASTVLGPFYLEAVNGRGLHIKFGTPKKITANTALTVTTSAAIAHSIDVTGFTAPG